MTDFDPEKLKHKPNEKHTLDEVLKSLQDLIHNDLLKGDAARPEEPPAPTDPAPAADEIPTATAPETTDFPDVLPGIPSAAADVPLGAVVQSLEELIKNDLALTDEANLPAAVIPDPEPPAPATPAAPTTGQQAFSFDDTATPAPAEPEPPAPLSVSEPTPPTTEPSDFDELTVDLAPPPGDFTKTENEVVEDAIAELPPDLPVLTESIAESSVPPVDDLPVLEEIALGTPGNDPAAIAIRVIARLNANRRARGEAELDDATLDALRVLLREEIERHQSER